MPGYTKAVPCRLLRPLIGPLALLAVSLCVACTAGPREADRSSSTVPAAAVAPSDADIEADEIRQLLAYAVAAARWEGASDTRTGHNIAAVLAGPDGSPVWWERNANFAEDSAIEHAEARLLRGYMADRRALGRPVPRLAGYSVYTTLEPCAMCVGMMIMADVDRVVFGQRDPLWGQAAERLSFDSRAQGGGWPPYVRTLVSAPSASQFRSRLEESYRRQKEAAITEWLDGPDAEEIFMESVRTLQRFQPKHAANQALLDAARAQYQLALENKHR